MKNLIERFNTKKTFLIISDYPEKSLHGEKNYGIAWHTKELLTPLAKKYGISFVVLAEKGENNKPELHQNGKILVLRVFDSNHHSLYPTVLQWLNVFNNVKFVQVHSEFCANGGLINQILLIPFLFLIKLTGRHISYFSHNVISTLNDIAPHLNLKNGSPVVKALNMGLGFYYKSLSLLVNQFVVMDQVIFKRLANFVGSKKIIYLPFWIQNTPCRLSKNKAKTLLGFKKQDKILLYFGFITYYKGADWIIRTFKELKQKKAMQNVHLVMAGGPAYSLKDRRYYKEYYEKIQSSFKKSDRIHITGFVPEDKINSYFYAADCAVFPYRGLIGGSATLTQAISYKTPFILSQPMHELLENEDFKRALEKKGVDEDYISFSYDHKSFYQAFQRSQTKKWKKTILAIIQDISKQRNMSHWVINCYNQLYRIHEYHKKTVSKARLVFSR